MMGTYGKYGILLSIAALWSTTGCHELTGNPGLPAGTPNPDFFDNVTGAVGMRNAALIKAEGAMSTYIAESGLLTDELEDAYTGVSQGTLLQFSTVQDPLDERILPVGTSGGSASYLALQGVRTYSEQALGALGTYDTATTGVDSLKILRGELYAMEGYAEIMLADLFCSGVPLSYLVYKKDYTYQPSSTTQQVYRDAIAKFDTALTLAATSDSVVFLSRVGQGRAFLDLGNYAAAADDVENVPVGFQYAIVMQGSSIISSASRLSGPGNASEGSLPATVADREGYHGLPYRSSQDPRTATVSVGFNSWTGDSLYYPSKYGAALTLPGYTTVILASGIEARLIQAEAALNGVVTGTESWIDQLNALRTDAGLPTIADPGDPVARVDTLFTERAYWLYLDGHRQGDLRRLLRQYGPHYQGAFTQEQVYPTGNYRGPGIGQYGTDVTVPIPTTEDANPSFHGCIDREP